MSTPGGWEGGPKDVDQSGVGFGLKKNNGYSSLEVEARHIGRLGPSKVSPKNCYVVVNLKYDGDITEFKAVESFDAGANGKLTIWRIRSTGDDYFLVLIVRKQTQVNVYLRGHDADKLKPYLESLKEVVRSVRFEPK